jgi:hypothetical protein
MKLLPDKEQQFSSKKKEQQLISSRFSELLSTVSFFLSQEKEIRWSVGYIILMYYCTSHCVWRAVFHLKFLIFQVGVEVVEVLHRLVDI